MFRGFFQSTPNYLLILCFILFSGPLFANISVKDYMNLAKKEFRRENYSQSERYLKLAQKYEPSNLYIQFNLANILFIKKYYKRAALQFQRLYLKLYGTKSRLLGLSKKKMLSSYQRCAFDSFSDKEYDDARFCAVKYREYVNDQDLALMLAIIDLKEGEESLAKKQFAELMHSSSSFVRNTASKYWLAITKGRKNSFVSLYTGFDNNLYQGKDYYANETNKALFMSLNAGLSLDNIFNINLYYFEPFLYSDQRFLSVKPKLKLFTEYKKMSFGADFFISYSNLDLSSYSIDTGSYLFFAYDFSSLFSLKLDFLGSYKKALIQDYNYINGTYLDSSISTLLYLNNFTLSLGYLIQYNPSTYYQTDLGINIPLGYLGNSFFTSFDITIDKVLFSLYASRIQRKYREDILLSNRIREDIQIFLSALLKIPVMDNTSFIINVSFTNNDSNVSELSSADESYSQMIAKVGISWDF